MGNMQKWTWKSTYHDSSKVELFLLPLKWAPIDKKKHILSEYNLQVLLLERINDT